MSSVIIRVMRSGCVEIPIELDGADAGLSGLVQTMEQIGIMCCVCHHQLVNNVLGHSW